MKNNKVLITTTTPYMIKSFLMNDIKILIELGYKVEVGTNFQTFNVMSDESLQELKKKLIELGVKMNQIEFSRSVFNLKKMLQSFNETKTLIDKNKYVIIHTHTPISGIITRLANKHTRTYSKTRMIYTAHGFHFFKGNNPIKNIIFKTIEKYAARYTDTLITINQEDYNAAKNFKLKNNGNVEWIPGVGINDKYNKKVTIKKDYRKELNICEKDFIILSVGELNNNKNHELVIRSIHALNDKKIHYIIAGRGSSKEKYLHLIKQLDMENHIHILGFREDIRELNEICDLFAFPSLREGLGLAALESMACGNAVIGTNTRGICEYVIDGKTGFLFENNIESCKNAIIKYMKLNNNEKKTFSLNCKKISEKYSSKKVQNDMRKIYEKEVD